MALIILALIALGIVICSGLYIWFMNRQWYRQNPTPSAPSATTTPTYDANQGMPPPGNA
jgi:hypothetical protein